MSKIGRGERPSTSFRDKPQLWLAIARQANVISRGSIEFSIESQLAVVVLYLKNYVIYRLAITSQSVVVGLY